MSKVQVTILEYSKKEEIMRVSMDNRHIIIRFVKP